MLSRYPFSFSGIHIKATTIQEVAEIGYDKFQFLKLLLMMDINKYYSLIGGKERKKFLAGYSQKEIDTIIRMKNEYDALPDADKNKITFFDVMLADKRILYAIQNMLNFFVVENIIYEENSKSFVCYVRDEQSEQHLVSYINADNYSAIVNIILQRLHIDHEVAPTEKKIYKNKLAEELYLKMQKNTTPKESKSDPRFELGNMVSALATHGDGLNIINIFSLTLYQLQDQFMRHQYNDADKMQSISISMYGDKDKKLNKGVWYSLINKDE